MRIKVISGGQTGVDVAALRAAKATNFVTGGMMPRGWRTLAGPRPEYATLYGMREASSPAYPPRTLANVIDAHATMRIARLWTAAGESCTLNAIRTAGRPPPFDVTMLDDPCGMSTQDVVCWICSLGEGITLNVAGNTEQTAPGIEVAAEAFLRRVFAEVAIC